MCVCVGGGGLVVSEGALGILKTLAPTPKEANCQKKASAKNDGIQWGAKHSLTKWHDGDAPRPETVKNKSQKLKKKN